jgi:hypothetical protein
MINQKWPKTASYLDLKNEFIITKLIILMEDTNIIRYDGQMDKTSL